MDELLSLITVAVQDEGHFELSRAELQDDGKQLVLSLRLHDPINEREEDWLVYCLGVSENRLALELHDAREVRDEHPRLVPYREPWLALYYASAPDDQRTFLEELRAAHDLGPFGQYGLGQNLSMGMGCSLGVRRLCCGATKPSWRSTECARTLCQPETPCGIATRRPAPCACRPSSTARAGT